MTMASRHPKIPLLVAAGIVLAGCGGVSDGKIQRWKTEPDGVDRLVAAVKDAKVAAPLRAQAVAALLEMGEVDRMDSAVSATPIEERAQVIPTAVPLVAAQLEGPRGWDAREALFALRQQATTDQARTGIDAVLFPALEKDLRAGRKSSGRHSVPEILIAVGAAAVPTLHRVLDDAKAPFAPAYEVLDKVGDKPAKEKGGAALAARARALPAVPPDLWTALGILAGKEATAFLGERLEK